MAINVSVQYNGRFLPALILLTLCYYHRGTRLNAMRFILTVLTFFPPVWGIKCSEGLDALVQIFL